MVCSVIVTDLRKLAPACHLWTFNLAWDWFVIEANLAVVMKQTVNIT